MEFVGRDGSAVLFSSDNIAVVVDETTNTVLSVGEVSVLTASASWDSDTPPSAVTIEIANAAVTDLDIHVFAENDRMYTIPKAVQAEARRALDWHKEHGRGGTSVGMNTARTLAEGGQIGIKKVRHIAKYFPRHEVDKKGKGYKPAEEGYPSNGRIAWALWGGDAAQRWASAIVEREDAKSASNFDMFSKVETIELSAFTASAGNETSSDEFYIRLFSNGAGYDRLYRKDSEGVLSVWDAGIWSDLGESSTSFSQFDNLLDNSLVSEHFHIPLDADAALLASAYLDNSPTNFAQVSDFNREEAMLAAAAFYELDWSELDAVIAAGEAPVDDSKLSEVRSQAVESQPRDAGGKFAKKGGRVSIEGNRGSGVIQSIEGANATVRMDDGTVASFPVSDTRSQEGNAPAPQAGGPAKKYAGGPLDVSGILAEPRAVGLKPGATLPNNMLPALTSGDLTTMMNDWPKWVSDQRSQFKSSATPQVHVDTEDEDNNAPNAFNDPYLRKWLDQKVKGKNGKSTYPNRTWYNPTRTDDIVKKKSAKAVGDKGGPLGGSKSGGGSSWGWRTTTKNGTTTTSKWSSSSHSINDALIAAAGEALTPKTSDVPPVYMAIVAPDDPQAVMDLISLIPASSESTEPAVFRFVKGKWEKDDRMMNDLKSPTPPPVVVLDNEALSSVLEQMNQTAEDEKATAEAEKSAEEPVTASLDEYLASFWSADKGMLPVTAAGGADRNRGNAEKLRRYWTIGEGGAKIRWGTGGDWTRCVRQLSKYLGPRAKGYCALRHKEMTGLWTGDKAHKQMYGRKGKGVFAMSDEMILSSEQVVEFATLRARVDEQKTRVLVASGGFVAPAETEFGANFTIPLVVPEGVETGDGRKFSKGSITMRELPLPLMWQIKTDEGHYGSVVVGRIDHMERTIDGIGNAHGVFDTGQYGKEAERLVRNGFIRGISADLDKFEADDDPEDAANKEKKGQSKVLISKARVMGVTLVPKPAFQECTIQLTKESDDMDKNEQDALIACASVVASIPVVPPRDWFKDPKLTGPTPLTVNDDGRVFGHIAAWHVNHIGLSHGTKPPRSKSNYSYFHTGVLRCDDGNDVPVGQLTLAGGHASLQADARAAAKHYDDTGSAFADVSAGEDAYGIWVAGSLRPEVSPQQVRAIRASAPSGDWRPIQGNLELVAVCQVNVPGFPIARARVASGQVYALVAAGASYLAELKENPELVLQAAEDAKSRFAAIRSEIEKTTITAGIDMAKENEPLTVEVLERLLSDVVSFYFRAQGYHWNVTGEDFAQYHALFADIYGDVYGSIDPIAENIRKLGGFPPFTLAEFVENRSIDDPKIEGGSPMALAADLLLCNESLIAELKAAFTVFNTANEQGVCNFLADRIDSHQKWSWQLASSVTPNELIIAENEESEDAFEAVFSALETQGLIASSQPWGDFANISEEARMNAAEKGFALPDGSYPIRNVKDLKNAIRAYGRSKPSDRAKVRAHIKKRANALKQSDLIPDTFAADSIELSATVDDLRSRIASRSITAAAEVGVEADPKA